MSTTRTSFIATLSQTTFSWALGDTAIRQVYSCISAWLQMVIIIPCTMEAHSHACMHTYATYTQKEKINYLEGVEVNAFNPLKESTEMFVICAFKNGYGSLHFSKGRNASLFV